MYRTALALIVAGGCWNETAFAPCASDEECAGGLLCLDARRLETTSTDSGAETSPICTRTCATAGDCPLERGCRGDGDARRADCVDGVCALKLCD